MAFRVKVIDRQFVDDNEPNRPMGIAVSVEMDRHDAANGGFLSFKVNGQEIKVNMPAGVLQTGSRVRLKGAAGPDSKTDAPDVYLLITIVEGQTPKVAIPERSRRPTVEARARFFDRPALVVLMISTALFIGGYALLFLGVVKF